MNSVYFLVVAVLVACVAGARPQEEIDMLKQVFPHFNETAYNELPAEFFVDQGPLNYTTPEYTACPSLASPPDAVNVSSLRPGNIKVVMAMGDSITAAMSAKDTLIFSLKEYRGISYAVGGDAGVTTLPNLLKPYLPAGYPVGISTGVGKRESSGTGLNAAVSGAINKDMLSQATWLVQQLKANKNVNFNLDWKVLTVWIGSNNLCDVCSSQNPNNGDNFQNEVYAALNYIQANVPRVFVNLVANLDISNLYYIDSGACSLIHWVACGCVSSKSDLPIVQKTGLDYQARAKTIAAKLNALNKPDFFVAVQPFLVNTLITDRKELSAADCFHPSAPSHGIAAVALWNNMLTPSAQKKTAWSANDQPICATAQSFISTL